MVFNINLDRLRLGSLWCREKRTARRVLSGSLSLLLLSSTLAALLPVDYAWAGPNVCATPGKDGPVNVSDIVNSYFPPQAGTSLSSGNNSLTLDSYYTEGADVPISAGDMLMIIQMQDAEIDSSNTAAYGSGNAANDGKGITALNNTGLYEFVRATNDVPLSGGTLNFVGGNVNDGVVNDYVNAAATPTRGRRTFQVIRMVQYASLTLTQDITVPDWNGQVGGVLALDIAGDMNFNGFMIDGTERGFRGGFIPNDTSSGPNNDIYVAPTTSTEVGGKGEGIAGTPHYTWDGTTAVDLGSEQLPGGDGGRGAPGNAGGGGNAHNAGGGGGSNGGEGGFGGIGWQSDQNGPLFSRGIGGAVPIDNPVGDRLIMGGGGGGGDVNNDTNGIRGGQGGGIVMIRADQFVGTGTIITNGSDGEQGEFNGAPDGAGGGGAGGTVALVAKSGDLSGITVEALGGDGGDTVRDQNNEHGPGGGGGGGVVISTSPGGQVPSANTNLAGGTSGRAFAGAGSPHGSTDGEVGIEGTLNPASVPPAEQGANCFPQIEVTKTEANPGPAGNRTAPNTAIYTITATNTGAGGAFDVRLSDELPSGFTYSSGATASFSGGATGPAAPTNTGTATVPIFGDFLIPEGGAVSITFMADISSGTASGTYQNPAYATYLDPSRDTSTRRISPSNGAMTGAVTTYEGGSQATQAVQGSNYISTSSPNEDVVIISSIQFSLAKRITAVNRGLADEQLFDAEFVDVGGSNDTDNLVNWPGPAVAATIGGGTVEGYLPGITDGAASSVLVRSGDQIEYTIPFLSHGGGAAMDVFICDRIPTQTTFVGNAFDGVTPAGTGSGPRGIFLSFDGQDVSLTNANDGDEVAATGGNNNAIGGYYFPAGVDPSVALGAPINCGGSNDNGAIVVDLNDVPNSTGDGVPADSFGFVRFRTVVD